MAINKSAETSLDNPSINIKIKLAALWTTLMFLYIYADYFRLMTPEKLENMIQLQTPMGPTTPELLVIFSIILIIPALMIIFSVFLNPKINKWLNIVIAFIYAGISLLIISAGINQVWQRFFIMFNLIEILVFVMIIKHAWNWPRN